MVKPKPASLRQRRRQQVQSLGDMAPQYRVGVDLASGRHDLTLRFPFIRSPLALIISGALLLVFSLPLFSVAGPLFDESTDGNLFDLVFRLFAGFWVLGWSVGVALLALVFFSLLCGRETLRVCDSKLRLHLGVFGLGVGATYDAALIRNFRSVAADEGMGNSWRGEHLAFDYANEPVHFASDIRGERATAILHELVALFPFHSSPPPDLSAYRLSATAIAAQAEPEVRQALPDVEQGDSIALGSISTIALIIANLIPLAGVLLDGWSIGEIMLLFWAESAVIGFYNLCKMWWVGRWSIVFYGPFFLGHYGAFMAGHLLFIYAFFGSGFAANGEITTAQVWADFLRLWPALLGFFISHGISYYVNFLGRKEYRDRNMGQQMGEPYKRIIIMHVTIIFGSFLVMIFSSALPALLLLILLKITADMRGHLREHH